MFTSKFLSLLLVFSSLLLNLVPGFAAEKAYVLILSKTSQQMIVLDYHTLDSIGAVSIGPDPHEIVTNEEGTRAYISNPQMNAAGHEIDIVDLTSLQLLKKIDTRPFFIPHGLVYRDGLLWFTAQGSKAVAQYNPVADRMEQVWGTGQDFTHLLYLRSDNNQFYTTNVASGTVSLFSWKQLPPYMPPTGVLPPGAKVREDWVQTIVPAGIGVEGFDVSEPHHELWAARPDGKVVIVDLQQQKVKDSIDTKVEGLHRLKITPDGKTVCIVSVKTGTLLYYDRSSRKLTGSSQIGQGAGIYIDKGRNRMFISCTPNNYVSVIDLNTREEVARLPVGKPDGITAVAVQE